MGKIKIQSLSPTHQYENTAKWDLWGNLVHNNPEGIGYIVIYPILLSDTNTDKFVECLMKFVQWWHENFEVVYQDAPRDGNYLRFNERLSETIYIARGSDTMTRMDALVAKNKQVPKNDGRVTEFKNYDRLTKYMNDYHRYKNTDMKNCLRDSYSIDMDTDSDNDDWPDNEVWLLKENDDLFIDTDYNCDKYLLNNVVKNRPYPKPADIFKKTHRPINRSIP
jgi:hypothetical protein